MVLKTRTKKILKRYLQRDLADSDIYFIEEMIKSENDSSKLEPQVMGKIADLIKDYESAKIKTTKEFAEKVFCLGYNKHLELMNKALSSENIFMLKEASNFT